MLSFGIPSILLLILTAALMVHVIKTGRSFIWVWVILWLQPGIGALAYILVEILPELYRSRTAQRASRGFRRALDPRAELRRRAEAARFTTNVETRQVYADELVRHGDFDEAIAQYRGAMTGLYASDPKLMLGLARAQFGKNDATGARATLDELLRMNPEFRSPDAQLLYARALESEGNVQKALEQYEHLAGSYPGAEAAVRYAQLLSAQGRREEARRVARELLDQARVAPPHYRKAQRGWLDSAERLAT